jgi:hypothetical protein
MFICVLCLEEDKIALKFIIEQIWIRGHAVAYLVEALCYSQKVAGSNPDEVDFFFNLPNSSNRNMALGSTKPLTEMSTRNLPGGNGRPARKTDNFTAICDPLV